MQVRSILLFVGIFTGTEAAKNYNATATFYKANSAPDVPENYEATLIVTGYRNVTCQFTIETPKCSHSGMNITVIKHLSKDWIKNKYNDKDRTLPFVPQFSYDSEDGITGIYPEYECATTESDKTYFHFESSYFGSGGKPDIGRN